MPGLLATLPPLDVAAETGALAHATRLAAGRQTVVSEGAPGRHFPSVRLGRASPTHSVSVVVLARDNVDRLDRCLAALAAQTSRHEIETIVVDGSARPWPQAGIVFG